ncbi:hypothetical protein BBP40_000520 [Aspergillus hancockii]|nr:hypothetical protein BBP40_000520 [Aspergillus hancockii]
MSNAAPSIIHGPSKPALKSHTTGHLLIQQATQLPTQGAAIVSAEDVTYTCQKLNSRAKTISRALIAQGIRADDRIGIFSGSYVGYAEVFLATTRIGAITVLPDIVYSATECVNTLKATEQYRELKPKLGLINLRTGLVGGAPTPVALPKNMHKEFGLEGLTVAHGTFNSFLSCRMTETSPISFMARASEQPDDGVLHYEILLHTSAKVVDSAGDIRGYYEVPEKTQEAEKSDSSGVVWMYMEDETVMDAEGHCVITGQIKDIIFRG